MNLQKGIFFRTLLFHCISASSILTLYWNIVYQISKKDFRNLILPTLKYITFETFIIESSTHTQWKLYIFNILYSKNHSKSALLAVIPTAKVFKLYETHWHRCLKYRESAKCWNKYMHLYTSVHLHDGNNFHPVKAVTLIRK